MALSFDPLTLNTCRWHVMWSIYVPNLNKIGPSAAELLTNNDIFFVRLGGAPILPVVIYKTRGPICIKLGGDIARLSLHIGFKHGDDILLAFQTTAAQSRALLSGKAKNHTF